MAVPQGFDSPGTCSPGGKQKVELTSSFLTCYTDNRGPQRGPHTLRPMCGALFVQLCQDCWTSVLVHARPHATDFQPRALLAGKVKLDLIFCSCHLPTSSLRTDVDGYETEAAQRDQESLRSCPPVHSLFHCSPGDIWMFVAMQLSCFGTAVFH